LGSFGQIGGFGPLLDFDMLVEVGAPRRAEIMDITYFEGYVDPVRGPLGFVIGLWDVIPWVFPMFRPYCKIL
jgi:hypothetical protein